MARILLINDISGAGKIAANAMNPILSSFGHEVINLPTALVSNPLNLPYHTILNTTEYLKEAMDCYLKLELDFDVICTGFIADIVQIDLILDFFKHYPKALKLVDPIFADNGKMYHGMNETMIEGYLQLCRAADMICPNYTEGCLLVNEPVLRDYSNSNDVGIKLSKLSHRVLLTGIEEILDESKVWCSEADERYAVTADKVEGNFFGTGDLFSAYFLAQYLETNSLKEAVSSATAWISTILKKENNHPENKFGLIVENYLKGTRYD